MKKGSGKNLSSERFSPINSTKFFIRSSSSDEEFAVAVFLGETLGSLSVDLFEDADYLSVTTLDIACAESCVVVLKFDNDDIIEVCTAVESILLNVLDIHTYAEVGEILTAVKCPVSDSFYS